MSRRRLTYALVVCAVLIAGVLLAPRVLLRDMTAAAVSDFVSRSLGREVRVGAVSIGFGPGLHVNLSDLDFGPELRADAARLRLALLPLLRGETQVRRVTLERARVDLTSTGGSPAGSSPTHGSWPELVMLDSELRLPGADRPLTRIHVDRLELTGLGSESAGQVDLSGTIGDGEAAFELTGQVGPLAGALSRAPLDLALSFSGVASEQVLPWLPESWQVESAEGALDGRISLRGSTAGDSQGDLTLELPDGSLRWNGTRIEGPARLASRWTRAASVWSWDVAALEFTAFGGRFEQEGRLALGSPPEFELNTKIAGVRVAELSDEISGDAELSARGHFAGSWTGGPDWLAPIEGSGRVAVTGGNIPQQRIVRAVARSLRSFVPGAGAVSGSVRPVVKAQLESATATFELAAGVSRTDDLEIITSDFRVHGKGTLSSDLALDLDLRVAFTAAGAGKVLSLALLPARVAGAEAPEIPVSVTGSLSDPQFQPHLPTVREAAVGLVAGTLKTGKSLATGAGRVLSRGAGAVREAAVGDDP